MTTLEQLADHARKRVRAEMKENSLDTMRELAMSKSSATGDLFAFEQALRKEDVSFICECKKASPSKGLIAPNFPYLEIAKEYEAAGADCISVLTEPKWFLGNDEYLKEIAESVSNPVSSQRFHSGRISDLSGKGSRSISGSVNLFRSDRRSDEGLH